MYTLWLAVPVHSIVAFQHQAQACFALLVLIMLSLSLTCNAVHKTIELLKYVINRELISPTVLNVTPLSV